MMAIGIPSPYSVSSHRTSNNKLGSIPTLKKLRLSIVAIEKQ